MNQATKTGDAAHALPKVLLVDDEEAIQKILKSVLEREGFEVWTANNGKAAQELVGFLDFKAVISDIKMPGVSGLELLKFIKNSHPLLPVVLMTGFSKVIETKDAIELGAQAFLAKPFKREELMQAIKIACGGEASAQSVSDAAASQPEAYCKIGIDQFISGKSMKFEIFIRLGDNRYTKIAHQGEDIDLARIQEFKSKNVEYLYIKASEFAKTAEREVMSGR